MADWGVPLDRFYLRCITKAYLDNTNRNIPRFKNNMPGDDWAKSFIRRHSNNLTERYAMNVKRSRANVSRKTINDFFDNLSKETNLIPATNIFNFDETNLCDDPGKKKIIIKRTCKRPERIINSSKSCISIMFCGNAAGTILPPYIVYKAEHLYNTWTLGGPKQSRFNRSRSGWFDLHIFEDWFESLFLPVAKKIPGEKILIGDNVSSHVSVKVLKLCQDNNIKLLFLPPNSTHLLQPLDVAFFAPLKKEWRKILEHWKSTSRGRNAGSLDKSQFPGLLKKLLRKCCFSNKTIKAGFRGAGIFPLNRNKVLEKLPIENTKEANSAISNEFINHLKSARYCSTPSTLIQRKRKINVAPGKSVCVEDVDRDFANSLLTKKKRVEQYVIVNTKSKVYPGKIVIRKVHKK